MKRAALYIRVSTEEQARHGLSLGEQRADLERYAQAHHYVIFDTYADEGNTARKSIKKRKELQRLLGDVKAGRIDIILFKCLDRWFRNIRDYYAVQDILDAHGVDWECTQEKYNTTTTNGRLMLNIKLSVAQNESDQTSDRIKYINEGKLRRHEALGGKCAYGYRIENKRYVIDEKQAPIVRYVYDRILAGDSSRTVAKRIYEDFGTILSVRQVRCIMANPVYIGTYHGLEDYHAPIVERDTYERVHTILAHRPKPVQKGSVFLFTGKIRCPSCGAILIAHKRYKPGCQHVPAYCCGRRYVSGPTTGKSACTFGGGVSEYVLERWLVNHLRGLLETYITNFERQQKRAAPDPAKKKKAAEGKLQRLKELYIDGLIEKPELKRRVAEYQQEIDEATIQAARRRELSPAVREAYEGIDTFKETYAKLDREHQREFWQKLIARIELGERPQRSGVPYSDFKIFFV